MPLVPLMAQATERIGIIATVATTFYPPFLAARLMATLDHVTKGRIGINLVTASADGAAQNYGLPKQIEHGLRYEMADEWIDVVSQLWDSWEEDALVLDAESGVFADHEKIHKVGFEGKYYASRGPLNVPRGPQGRPVICQAGGSPAGRAFGAKHADTIIANVRGLDAMREYREDISKRLLEYGRKPDDVKVLFLVSPIMADTDQEAAVKRDRMREVQKNNIDGVLAAMSYLSSTDFSQFDIDAPVPDLTKYNGHKSTLEDMAKSGKTLREIIANYPTVESIELVGTTESVAAQMDEAMDYVGGDGFLIASPVTRKVISEISDGLAPALRRRGAIRDGYSKPTFRENLAAF
nr:NtaA/DmoA family FMN-dependent monooxygenase [Rhodococcus sp. 15-1154-1]